MSDLGLGWALQMQAPEYLRMRCAWRWDVSHWCQLAQTCLWGTAWAAEPWGLHPTGLVLPALRSHLHPGAGGVGEGSAARKRRGEWEAHPSFAQLRIWTTRERDKSMGLVLKWGTRLLPCWHGSWGACGHAARQQAGCQGEGAEGALPCSGNLGPGAAFTNKPGISAPRRRRSRRCCCCHRLSDAWLSPPPDCPHRVLRSYLPQHPTVCSLQQAFGVEGA